MAKIEFSDNKMSETPASEMLPLSERLKVKRAKLAQKRAKELRALDRQIDLLEASNAEAVVAEGYELLHQEM